MLNPLTPKPAAFRLTSQPEGRAGQETRFTTSIRPYAPSASVSREEAEVSVSRAARASVSRAEAEVSASREAEVYDEA